MKAILVNKETNIVYNVSGWTEESTVPVDCTCVIVEDNFYVGPNFTWEGGNTFVPPVVETEVLY